MIMGAWSCQHCTLNNDDSSVLCAACGSQNPATIASSRNVQLRSFLPKLPRISISGALNAVDTVLVNAGLLPPPATSFVAPNPPSSSSSTIWYDGGSNFPIHKQSARIIQPSHSSPPCDAPRGSPPKERRLPHEFPQQLSCSSSELQQRDEETASHEYNRIVDFCKANNIPFIDDSFPHSQRSIGDLSNNQGAVPSRINLHDLIWLRPQEMFTKDGQRYSWQVFRDPKASDIEQGALGNCWFLSALAVIAERPDILEQIVLTKTYNPAGVYQIRLCVDGLWQVVVVDDFFPCNVRYRGLAFAVGRRNQLWVPLIEKALAKITGCYAKLLAGRTIEGLAVLTGAPCCLIDLEDANSSEAKDLLWASLLSMREARFVMGCSCGAGKRFVDDAEYKKVGLQAKHAYSLLDVTEFEGHRLVRLRNPWGTFVWNGEWSDCWPGWTTQNRSALLPDGIEAGAFWMPFEEFLRRFDSVDVAKVRSAYGWKELRVECTLPSSWGQHYLTGVRVRLNEPSEVTFTLYQKGARERTETDLMILIHSVGPPNTAFGELLARSSRKMAAFVSTGDVFLRGPADYVVLPVSFSNMNEGKDLKMVVAIHSAKSLIAQTIHYPSEVIADALVELALKEGKTHSSLEGAIPRYVSDDFGGHLLVVDNVHERRHLHVHCDCSQSSNVLSTRFTLSTVDSIPPMNRQIVMMLNHFEPTQSYSLLHSLTLRLSSSPDLKDWVSLVPGQIPLPANTQHLPPLNDPSVAVLHRPRPLFR